MRRGDPNLGRWTQQDPRTGRIAAPKAQTRYVYVSCDPVNGIDQNGLDCTSSLVLGAEAYDEANLAFLAGGLASIGVGALVANTVDTGGLSDVGAWALWTFAAAPEFAIGGAILGHAVSDIWNECF